MMDIQAVKRHKTYFIEENGEIVLAKQFSIEDEQRHTLSTLSLLNNDKVSLDSAATIKNDDKALVLEDVQRALGELNLMLNLTSLIKNKEYFSLQAIPPDSSTHNDPKLSASQAIELSRSMVSSSKDIIEKGLASSASVVQSRRAFASSCLYLRKKWRLMRISPHRPISTRITSKDMIAIDCSFYSAGDMTMEENMVPLTVTDSGVQILPKEFERPLCYLKLTFSTIEGQELSSFHSIEILGSQSSPEHILKTLHNVKHKTDVAVEDIDHYCTLRLHDTLCRRLLSLIKSEVTDERHVWLASKNTFTSGDKITQKDFDDYGMMTTGIVVRHMSRTGVTVSISNHINLSITSHIIEQYCEMNKNMTVTPLSDEQMTTGMDIDKDTSEPMDSLPHLHKILCYGFLKATKLFLDQFHTAATNSSLLPLQKDFQGIDLSSWVIAKEQDRNSVHTSNARKGTVKDNIGISARILQHTVLCVQWHLQNHVLKGVLERISQLCKKCKILATVTHSMLSEESLAQRSSVAVDLWDRSVTITVVGGTFHVEEYPKLCLSGISSCWRTYGHVEVAAKRSGGWAGISTEVCGEPAAADQCFQSISDVESSLRMCVLQSVVR